MPKTDPKQVGKTPTDVKSTKPVDKKSNEKKETKSETFLRIAEPRVMNVKNALRILGNCGNRNNYEYTSEQIEAMFDSISETYSNALAKFSKSKDEQIAFKF